MTQPGGNPTGYPTTSAPTMANLLSTTGNGTPNQSAPSGQNNPNLSGYTGAPAPNNSFPRPGYPASTPAHGTFQGQDPRYQGPIYGGTDWQAWGQNQQAMQEWQRRSTTTSYPQTTYPTYAEPAQASGTVPTGQQGGQPNQQGGYSSQQYQSYQQYQSPGQSGNGPAR